MRTRRVSLVGAIRRSIAPGAGRRRIVVGFLAAAFVAAAAAGGADRLVAHHAGGRIFAVEAVPVVDVAVVLGTVPRVGARPNFFYEARLDAAADLFRRGRVRGILVTGDNSRRGYDEPSAMKRDLVARGVPAEYITCDFAGFRTLDSVQRARRVFGLRRAVIVSQEFHLERALFLADACGLEAVGCRAADAPRAWQVRTRMREVLARAAAVVDVAVGREPRFLGRAEVVPLASSLPPVDR